MAKISRGYTQRRIVFIGFGFNDPEVMRLLKLISRYSTPDRPIFAFLAGLSGSRHEAKRIELLESYNVDVIPYDVVDGSHNHLHQLLEVYSSLILRRSLRFGQPERSCPSYDPETTSLLVYNQLTLARQRQMTFDVANTLLKARILAAVAHTQSITVTALQEDLSERIKLLQDPQTPAAQEVPLAHRVAANVESCLGQLALEGFIRLSNPGSENRAVSLTEEGRGQVLSNTSRAEMLSDQFSACLTDRAREISLTDEGGILRVAKAAEEFLKDCVRRRALGVAMAWYSPTSDYQQYHVIALLQALPDSLQQLHSSDEGRALVGLIQQVLCHPKPPERKFLGTLLQAYFGLNLLGYDPEIVNARARELSKTVFIVDSSTLIPRLARSSVGHDIARVLISGLLGVGAKVVTTRLLATEVAEHAGWALNFIRASNSDFSHRLLIVAGGRAGSSLNAFVDGFLAEISAGEACPNFGSYLDTICQNRPASYNAPGKLDRGISYKAVSEQRSKERSWRHSATTTVPSSKPR